MGESQTPRAGRPLLFSPVKGRDAGARGLPNLRKQVLSLAGAVRPRACAPSLREQVLSLVGRDREGLALVGRNRESLAARRRGRGLPWVPPCTVTAALFALCLDAPVPLDAPVLPVISKKPRQQEAAPHAHARSPRYPAGDHPLADPSAALRRRPAPPRPARRRLGSPDLKHLRRAFMDSPCTSLR